MKEEHIWTKKPETMLDWFCVVGACIALYLALNNLGYFLGKIGVFIGIVSPFAGGIVIAYVLDPMVKFFYTKLFKEKKKTRGFAILLAYLVAILLLVLLAWLVIPQIVDSIAMLFTNFPSYIQSVQDMLGMVQERFGVDLSSATKVLDDSEAMVKEIYNMASAAMPQIVASIGSVASNFVAIFTSIAASIYMLADKEHLLHQLHQFVITEHRREGYQEDEGDQRHDHPAGDGKAVIGPQAEARPHRHYRGHQEGQQVGGEHIVQQALEHLYDDVGHQGQRQHQGQQHGQIVGQFIHGSFPPFCRIYPASCYVCSGSPVWI